MVDKKFDALNAYLGFETESDAEVPSGTGKEKVVRKKAYGDWRHWYTEDDVVFFKSAYTPYMEIVGYDCDDLEYQRATPYRTRIFISVYAGPAAQS
jgi:hypothetical protein